MVLPWKRCSLFFENFSAFQSKVLGKIPGIEKDSRGLSRITSVSGPLCKTSSHRPGKPDKVSESSDLRVSPLLLFRLL